QIDVGQRRHVTGHGEEPRPDADARLRHVVPLMSAADRRAADQVALPVAGVVHTHVAEYRRALRQLVVPVQVSVGYAPQPLNAFGRVDGTAGPSPHQWDNLLGCGGRVGVAPNSVVGPRRNHDGGGTSTASP